MKTKMIELPLDIAQNFYNSGDDRLKSLALQAFTEEELCKPIIPTFDEMKTWEDVCNCSFCEFGANDKYIIISNINKEVGNYYKIKVIWTVVHTLFCKHNPEFIWQDNDEPFSLTKQFEKIYKIIYNHVCKYFSNELKSLTFLNEITKQ
jgi:hypothetical protein